ncbi:unnamed protein product [Notodromas monacha]|uniref:Non-specific lipid-transfer protein n=1 Tax=Notodromas monacha TaxID=399045 RepID=A0A7R9BKU6_9CRUS|nr:unnamed protein product [Notodromas monacha]CAG0917333.1 unnamed protein product [Notodromas monacha]
MGRKVYVIGVGMTKFEKPGKHDASYVDLVRESVTDALSDAKVSYDDIKHAFVGYVYGDSTSGQKALYEIGLTGIPIQNVNNNCSTGSSALYLGCKFVESGLSDCVLAVGFEKMQPGSLGLVFPDQPNPLEKHIEVMGELEGIAAAPFAAQLFGNAGREHMKLYGTTKTHLAKIAHKNHLHSVNNPKSQFRDEYSLEQILKSPVVHEPLTKLQCCPTSDGSAAVVIVSEDFLVKRGLVKSNAVEVLGIEMCTDTKSSFSSGSMRDVLQCCPTSDGSAAVVIVSEDFLVKRGLVKSNAVEVLGIEMCTDTKSSFSSGSMRDVVGYSMSKAAANAVFSKTGKTPSDVQVVELHDCFSANELITYEALGLTGLPPRPRK